MREPFNAVFDTLYLRFDQAWNRESSMSQSR